MEKQEFLDIAKNNIKGSLHEGFLYTEIQEAYKIIEKYNESMHILNLNKVSSYNDDRYVEIRDTHDASHGLIFMDKDKFYFTFDIDDYRLTVSVENLCKFYKKHIEFERYTEVFEDEKEILRTIPDEYTYINSDGEVFIKSKSATIHQIFGNSDNSIEATITNFDESNTSFVTKNFEYNSLGITKHVMSLDSSDDKYVTRFVTNMIKTPSNTYTCVSNKAFGYDIMLGIEQFIKNLQNRDFKNLKCDEISYYRNRRIKKANIEKYTEPSFLDD